jgi:uncharacterized protein
MTTWGHLEGRYGTARPRKMLSFDGGGVRGVLSLEILRSIETLLAKETGAGDDFRLSHYFDYIGGTSTGSVVATCVALGKTVDEIMEFYVSLGSEVFKPELMMAALREGDHRPFEAALQKAFGKDTTLGTEELNTLLMVVLHNNTTDSAWPLSNNPREKYNDRSFPGCNLQLPLWQLVRCSTAFPGIFPPEEVTLPDGTKFQFDDGGVSPFINPAFMLYKKATMPEYGLGWETGEDKLLLISVGTGSTPMPDVNVFAPTLVPPQTGGELQALASSLGNLVGVVMYGAQVDQDVNCRAVGRCVHGDSIDGEVADMIPRDAKGHVIPLAQGQGRHFLYARYDITFTQERLDELGLSDIPVKDVQTTADFSQVPKLRRVGEKLGEAVKAEHFGSFL